MILSGHGKTTVKNFAGQEVEFEWGPGALFAIPLNTVRTLQPVGIGARPVRRGNQRASSIEHVWGPGVCLQHPI